MTDTPPLDEGAARTVGTLQGKVTLGREDGCDDRAGWAAKGLLEALAGAKGRGSDGEDRVLRRRVGQGKPFHAKRGRDRRGGAGRGADRGNRGNRVHYEESWYGTAHRGR